MLFLRVLWISSIVGVLAFAPSPMTRRSSSLNEGRGDGDDTGFDVEDARMRLNKVFRSSNTGSKKTTEEPKYKPFSEIIQGFEDDKNDFDLSLFPPPPPLSSIERERRLGEIQLLQRLKEGDEVVPELWNHWYSERGSSAKQRIEKIGELLTDPRDWKGCEKELIDMVDEYGIYFVEPVNLLATLYFLMGKLKLSYKLCEIILTLKPYHIGALSGIVQVSLGMNDPVSARNWAKNRLPKSSAGSAMGEDGTFDETKQESQNQKRVEWIETAVAKAEDLLEEAEKRTRVDFFGKPETYYDNDSDGAVDDIGDDLEDGAWQ